MSGADAQRERRAALVLAGVADPALSDLARCDGLTPEAIRDLARAVKRRRKGVGVLVRDLQAAAERVEAQAALDHRQAAEADQRKAQQAAAAAQDQADQQAAELASADAWRRRVDEMGPDCAAIVQALREAAISPRAWSLCFAGCDWRLYGRGTQLVCIAPHDLARRQIAQSHLAALEAATPDGVEVVVVVNDGSVDGWWVDGFEHQRDGIDPIIQAVEAATPLADDEVSRVERTMLIGEAKR